jgi:hypothetical protein
MMTFRRLTGLSSEKGRGGRISLAITRGVILERTHGIYLIGLNTRGANREPTFIAFVGLPFPSRSSAARQWG